MPTAHRPASTNALNTLAGAALVAGLVAGCTPAAGSTAAPHVEATAPATAATTPAPAWAPDATDASAGPAVPEGRYDRFRKDWVPGQQEAPLGWWLGYAIDPPGHRVDIALRFTQALQQHDDFAAGLELSSLTRTSLGGLGDPQLQELMADVRGHAGLDAAGTCTRGRDLDADSVVVTCGRTNVVVHLDTFLGPGVLISDWWTHEDVFRGPHTHAYTTLEY